MSLGAGSLPDAGMCDTFRGPDEAASLHSPENVKDTAVAEAEHISELCLGAWLGQGVIERLLALLRGAQGATECS